MLTPATDRGDDHHEPAPNPEQFAGREKERARQVSEVSAEGFEALKHKMEQTWAALSREEDEANTATPSDAPRHRQRQRRRLTPAAPERGLVTARDHSGVQSSAQLGQALAV